MTQSFSAWLLLLSLSVVLASCATRERAYQTDVKLGKPLEFRPRYPFPKGEVGSNACLQGNYNHVYRTNNGQYGQSEVWLCCVPVAEILKESFNCGSVLPAEVMAQFFGGSAEYWKIRTCSLSHPTASEPTYVPVCIQAPERADTSTR